ncbi:MAG TPA: hypothetical protein VGK26_12025 [Thermoanaerobaculia bacterium]
MPRPSSVFLKRLEAARHLRPGVPAVLRLLRTASRLEFRDPEDLIRLHEALLFLRAYPHDARVLRASERLLRDFARRVARLRDSDSEFDLDAFDALEVAGVAGTVVSTDFSFDLVRRLLPRHPRELSIDWDACNAEDRMRATWPAFVPLLEEEALADANVPYREWLAAAAGREENDAAWIVPRYEALPGTDDDRAERWDSLGAPVAWDLARSRSSRTRMRRPGPSPFFHGGPLLPRREVSLDAIVGGPPLALRRLSRREGERVCDMVRDATAVRYREFYTFTYADPASVVSARPGRGVELFLLGVTPDRRLPLRAAYGGFVVKNGVPVGYIEGLAFLERLEIGFNVYYTFREGESAWIYAQVLRLHRDALGVTSFSIDPYQLGFQNEEAISSGAFWFYRKLGFRPTDASVARGVAREESRIARDPAYRSSPAALRRLVTHNVLYEAPGGLHPRGEWDRFHVREIGLAVNRRMRREFGGSAARLRTVSEGRVAAALGMAIPREQVARRAFSELALVLDLIPDLERWSAAERRAAAAVVRAKAGPLERAYLRGLQRHARLRRALIRLGTRA